MTTTTKPPVINPDQLLVTAAQARVMLGGIGVTTLRRRIAEGALKPIARRNAASGRTGKLYFRERDIHAFIESQAAPTDPQQ